MVKKQNKKYLYKWMSFAEKEAPLLETYLNQMAQEGYEITKIARYYLRFKKVAEPKTHYYVRSYRKHYVGHLYWQFSDTPLAPSKSYGSRKVYHLSILIALAVLLAGSIFYLPHLNYRLLYSDGALALVFSLPFFAFSFFLDFLGRFFDSCSHHQKPRFKLKFACFRALFLGINMFSRYFVLMVLIIPLFLKELHLPVVFIILTVVIYEVASYYLPDKYRAYSLIASFLMALMTCLGLSMIQKVQPYHKNTVNYENLTLMRLSHLIDQEDFDESQNYSRQVHRYTSTSLYVPFYYQRSETMSLLNQKNPSYKSVCTFTICKDEDTAKRIYAGMIADYEQLEEYELEGAKQAHLLGDFGMIAQVKENIYFYEGNFDILDQKVRIAFMDFIKNNTKECL